MIKRLLQAATLGVALTAASFGAHALPIGLSLALDESGSIAPANFQIQRAGYIAALQAALPLDGSIVLNIVKFDSSAETVFATRLMDDAGDLQDAIDALNGMVQGQGGTNIGAGINLGASGLAGFGYANLESAVIDVSTDGFGSGAVNAANAFVAAAGATASGEGNVNCLGIGAGARCDFETGPDSFEVIIAGFGDLEDALIAKIKRETGQTPIPATLALFGLGLLVMGGVARKSKQS